MYIRISLGTYYKADACPLLTKSKMRLSSLYFAQDLPISQEIPGNPNHTLRNVPGQFSNQLLEAFLGLELKSTSLKSHPLVRIVTKKENGAHFPVMDLQIWQDNGYPFLEFSLFQPD